MQFQLPGIYPMEILRQVSTGWTKIFTAALFIAQKWKGAYMSIKKGTVYIIAYPPSGILKSLLKRSTLLKRTPSLQNYHLRYMGRFIFLKAFCIFNVLNFFKVSFYFSKNTFFLKVISKPGMGLELMTPRSRVSCLTNWARQAPLSLRKLFTRITPTWIYISFSWDFTIS